MTGIKACPFCGCDAEYGHIDANDHPDCGGHYIQCTNASCEASTNLRFAAGDDPRPLLAEQWNMRWRQAQAPVIAEEVVRRVCELPDRTSPTDEPNLLNVTYDELMQIVLDVVEQAAP